MSALTAMVLCAAGVACWVIGTLIEALSWRPYGTPGLEAFGIVLRLTGGAMCAFVGLYSLWRITQ